MEQGNKFNYHSERFFLYCLKCAASNKELVTEFDRLTGHNLSRAGSGFELLIDDATGRTEVACKEFIEFVEECIYYRLFIPK